MAVSEKATKWYSDLDRLDIRFKQKEIVRATGEPKANVSRYMNKILPPSDSFLERFYKAFGKKLETNYNKVPQGNHSTGNDIAHTDSNLTALIQNNTKLADTVVKLTDNNSRLVNLVVGLTEDSREEKKKGEAAAYKTLSDVIVKVGVDAGSWKSEKEGKHNIHTVALSNAPGSSQEDM